MLSNDCVCFFFFFYDLMCDELLIFMVGDFFFYLRRIMWNERKIKEMPDLSNVKLQPFLIFFVDVNCIEKYRAACISHGITRF